MGRLFWKFFFFTLLAQVVATVGIGGAFWLKNYSQERKAPDIGMGPFAASQVESAAAVLQYGGVDALTGFLGRSHHRQPVYAVDSQGVDVLGREVHREMIDEARQLLGSKEPRSPVRDIVLADGRRYLLFSGMGHPPDGGPPMDAGPLFSRGPGGPPPPGHRPFLHALLPALSGLLVSLIIAWLLAWYFSKPIRNLRSAFGSLADGKLETRLGGAMGNRRDELVDLGQDFDKMAGRLSGLVEGQQKLMHDISHELRSPLARVQAAIGLARQNPDKTEATLQRIEKESERMDKLIGELLTLSKLDAGDAGMREETIDVGEMIEELVEDARIEAEGAGCRIEPDICCASEIRGDGDLLRRAVENVIRNAIKYSGRDAVISVSAEEDQHNIRIAVLDRGPGVPEAELDSIFEPFFRGSGTSKSNDGHGLGLSIAKRIVEMHGGRIRAGNLAHGGLRVDIVFVK